MENKKFLEQQIITYIGNKRELLDNILSEVRSILKELNTDKCVICDMFSGSGIVSRALKQYSSHLYTNDLEDYAYIINSCYLTNKENFDENKYDELYEKLISKKRIKGIITENYAPQNDKKILKGERVFYTQRNAITIDTIRNGINEIPEDYQKFFLAPLLYEASVHTNTSGVFKGFYKSKKTNIGKFGGDGENAISRICGEIELKKPIFSNHSCQVTISKEDANVLAKNLKEIDITYMDPPYNQHPYSSNYFMLNTIVKNEIGENISKVSGIPTNWNKSRYNKKSEALIALEELVSNIDSKYLIISYNNEGFITLEEMQNMLSKYGELKTKEINYNAFRGSRNLQNRSKYTTEYIFVLKKNSKNK